MDLETMQTSSTRARDTLKLLGQPHRLMVLCELKKGEKSVSELANKVGVSQSPLSQHLREWATKTSWKPVAMGRPSTTP